MLDLFRDVAFQRGEHVLDNLAHRAPALRELDVEVFIAETGEFPDELAELLVRLTDVVRDVEVGIVIGQWARGLGPGRGDGSRSARPTFSVCR